MHATHKLIAASLALMGLVGLSACTQTDRQLGYETEEQRTGTSAVRGTGEERREAVGEDLDSLTENQPVSFYQKEFERLGYAIQDVRRVGDQVIYRLEEAGRRFDVALHLNPNDRTKVRDIEVNEMTALKSDDPQVRQVAMQVEKLKPGKNPAEYISQLDALGRVTGFSWRGDQAQVEIETGTQQTAKTTTGTTATDRKLVNVLMAVDEKTDTVTSFDVDKAGWGLGRRD